VSNSEQTQHEPLEPPAENAQQDELPSDPAGTFQDQLAEAKDRALRAQAELENFRKRAHREMGEERRYANIHLMRELFPVIDNIDRAIEAAEKSSEASGLLEGVKMVAEQLQSVLARHHCLPIDAEGQPFDPNLHEAISQHPSDEHPENTVLLVTQKGYQLHDRVARPSQVVVTSKPPGGES